MPEWLDLGSGPPLALTGKSPLGGSIGQAPRPLQSGTAISKVPFALENEPRRLSLRRPPRRRSRVGAAGPEVKILMLPNHVPHFCVCTQLVFPSSTVAGRVGDENPLWGVPRIQSELRLLGYEVAESTIGRYRVRNPKPPSQS